MAPDRSEDEPEEYDPEAEFRDPDSDSLTIPEVSTERAGSTLRSDLQSEIEDDVTETPDASFDEVDVDSDLLTDFWALVLIINVVVFAYALAALFLVFEGETEYATYLFAGGLVLTGFGIHRYRAFKNRDDSAETAAENADETSSETEPADSPGSDADEITDADDANDTNDADDANDADDTDDGSNPDDTTDDS
ncbi:DUF7322 domain-containing protein [Natronorubrum daqingense]|uniref:DUF7322 domain-containing protein n=1 Tax=Natronorubrum daqingense TaxID=588898 RepID=A0A1N6Y3P1_9EURY|nr:hypothetical protein [Natronorubrum daqingense]APX95790.1 hypothetical protein BB347_03690 [Natronorubrum daqingense]SIR09166.1 hypothetical protein SAMN05421809_0303 [Natronorubrum daqingense]